MSRARILLSTLSDLFPRLEIEDRAVNLLERLPPDIGLSAAVTVAKSKIQRWGTAKSEMRRQRDPRLVYLASFETAFLDIAVATAPSDAAKITRVEAYLLTIFASLPVDAAALAALMVAQRAIDRANRGRQ